YRVSRILWPLQDNARKFSICTIVSPKTDTICILDTSSQPHGGFAMKTIEGLKVYNSAGKYVVHIPARRGEELFLYLANHGIESRVSRIANAPFDRLEVEKT